MTRRILGLAVALTLTLAAPVAACVDQVNGIFASSSSDKAKLASIGLNAVTVNASVTELDAAAREGLRGVVWVGGYDNTACRFTTDDAWVTSHVNAVKKHLAVVAYQIDNEPHASCPGAVDAVRHRSELVRSLDPNPDHLTLLALYRDYDFDDFAGVTDVLRVGMYPCSWEKGCVYQKITDKVAAARAAGWTDLWGSPQAFGNSYYRIPTLDEERLIRQTWRNNGVTNLLAYQWDKGETEVLVNHPELWPAFSE